ncbi:hypothetical protein EPZ47_21100 [Pseudomonas viciae]|uniref:Uncharacterized protein n=1 Tax=Pseudomonas viciae TaxID=2505979 RepID=A0A4P7PK95_9PSED|nr:hypothetical protein EPZ47_21100 [Pseudomonas viciae]
MLAIQAPRFQRDRVVFIAGKPCSHKTLVRRFFSNPNPHALSCPPSKNHSPQDPPHESRPHRTHQQNQLRLPGRCGHCENR